MANKEKDRLLERAREQEERKVRAERSLLMNIAEPCKEQRSRNPSQTMFCRGLMTLI